MAKDALKHDLADGRSWFVLGNAYLALFFDKMETVEHIRQALKSCVVHKPNCFPRAPPPLPPIRALTDPLAGSLTHSITHRLGERVAV
jgi:hypothetical protein